MCMLFTYCKCRVEMSEQATWQLLGSSNLLITQLKDKHSQLHVTTFS